MNNRLPSVNPQHQPTDKRAWLSIAGGISMTPIQNDQLQEHPSITAGGSLFRGQDLSNQTPRTLLWGYTSSFHSFHVYLDEQAIIHKVVYAHNGKAGVLLIHQTQAEIVDAADYVPDKWAYPEACDQEFCAKLVEKGARLPFAAGNRREPPAPSFRGERLERLVRRI
jgi:hypothetical protein